MKPMVAAMERMMDQVHDLSAEQLDKMVRTFTDRLEGAAATQMKALVQDLEAVQVGLGAVGEGLKRSNDMLQAQFEAGIATLIARTDKSAALIESRLTTGAERRTRSPPPQHRLRP